MSWLVDHAGMVYLVLGLFAIGFFAAYRTNRRVLHLAIGGGFLVLMLLFWLLTRVVLSDSQQIEQNLRTMADAVVKHDADRLFQFIARDFEYLNLNREQLHEHVKQTIKLHRVNSMQIWGYEPEEVSRSKGHARVRFKATVGGAEGERPFGVRAEFKLEDNVWKLRSFQLFNNFTNFEQPIDIPLR